MNVCFWHSTRFFLIFIIDHHCRIIISDRSIFASVFQVSSVMCCTSTSRESVVALLLVLVVKLILHIPLQNHLASNLSKIEKKTKMASLNTNHLSSLSILIILYRCFFGVNDSWFHGSMFRLSRFDHSRGDGLATGFPR